MTSEEFNEIVKPISLLDKNKREFLKKALTKNFEDWEREQLELFGVGIELPTREEMLSRSEDEVNKGLIGNTTNERATYKLGFYSCYCWLKNHV